MHCALRHPKDFQLTGPGGEMTQGADQAWFPTLWQQRAGCGPTAAAMLIETLTGKTYTPVDACAWSIEHGYKALKQGTYYAYFKPQFAAFGISYLRASAQLLANASPAIDIKMVSIVEVILTLLISSQYFLHAWRQKQSVK